MNEKKFIKIYLSSVLVFTIAIFLFNYIIDPYGLNNQVIMQKVNKIKTQTETKNRKYKVRLAEQNYFEGVFLGNSRMERLGNTEVASKFLKQQFINLSFGAQTIYESYYYLDYFVEKKPIKTVILSLDPYQFLKHSNFYEQDKPENIINKMDDLKFYFYYYTIYDSLKTVYKNLFFPVEIYNKSGERIVDELAYNGISKETEDQYLKSKVDINKLASIKNSSLDPVKLEYLFDLIKLCERNKISLYIYFNPSYLTVFYKENINLVKQVIQLKTALVKKSDFYDFSGISLINNNHMNFWDGSHAKNAIAYKILNCLLDNKCNNIGSLVTKETIDLHIDKYLKEMNSLDERYSSNNSML